VLLALSGILASAHVAGANEQIIRGMIGVGTAIIQNEINKQAAPKPPRSSSSSKSGKKSTSGKGSTSGPALSASEVRAIQARLNELGFGAGQPDGALGPGTRQAIKRWQAANGLAVTGHLDAAQAAALFSGDPVVAAGGEPVEEPPLTRAEIRQFQTQLNQLGYAVGRPDGVAGPQTGRAVARFLRDRGYDPYQVSPRAALALAVTGEMPAVPPGVAMGGGATAHSILGDAPAAADGASASVPVATAPVDFDPKDYVLINDNDPRDTFARDIALRVAATMPSMIEDEGIVRRWLEWEHPRSSKPGAESDIAAKYWHGTQFDKQDAIAAFRAGLPARAVGQAPLKVAFPIKLSGLKGYVEGTGFPLDFVEYTRFQPLEYKVGNLLLRHSILMLFPDAPMIDAIPVVDEAEARQFADTLANISTRSLRMYVTIDSVGPETVGDGDTIRATATLDAIVLHGRRRGTGEEVELYRWNATPAAAPAVAGSGLDVAQAAAFASLPMAGGRLLAIADDIVVDSWKTLLAMAMLGADHTILDDDETAFLYALSALTRPELVALAQGEDLSNRYGTSALRNMDEFTRRAFMARLRADYLPKILGRTPDLPFPMVEVFEGTIGEYDFDNGTFSLAFRGNSRLQSMSEYTALPLTTSPLAKFPDSLVLPLDQAEYLVRVLKSRGENRRVYLAVYGSLGFQFGGKDHSHFISTPERIALFVDEGLTSLVAEFEVAPYLREGPAPEDPSVVAARTEVGTVTAKPVVRSHVLAALARDFPASQGYFDVFVDSAMQVRQANEFDRQAVRAQLEKAILDSVPDDGEIWLKGEITLGEYDPARGGFPITSVTQGYFTSDLEPHFAANIKIVMRNLDAIGFLPMATEAARQLIADQPDRTFAIRMRIVPVGASWDKEDYGRPELELLYTVAELYALDRNEWGIGSATKVIAHLTPQVRPEIAAPEAAAPPAFAEREVLNQDMLYTIAAHSVADRLDDAAIDWLMVNRFASDMQVKPSWPSRFFNDDARPLVRAMRDRFAGPYREWLAAQDLELPKKLTLVVERRNLRIQGAFLLSDLLPAQCHHLSPEPRIPNMPPEFGRPSTHEIFEAQVNGPSHGQYAGLPMVLVAPAYLELSNPFPIDCAQGGGMEAVRKEFAPDDYPGKPVVLVEVDRLPLPPRHPAEYEDSYIEVDVAVDGIAFADNGSGVPHVHLKTTMEEVRFGTFDVDEANQTPFLTQGTTIRREDTVKPTFAEQMGGKAPDILGITIGQSMAEAEAIVVAHLGTPTILDAVVDPGNPNLTYQDARLFVRPDGYEQITLFRDPAPGRQDQVIGVARGLIAPSDTVPGDALLASVRDKFGAETFMEQTATSTTLVWGDDVARVSRADPSRMETTDCAVETHSSPSYWTVDGRRTDNVGEFIPWNEVRKYPLISWPHIRGFANATREDCGLYIRVDVEQQEKNGFWMFVTDLGAYSRGVIERATNPPSAAPSADVSPEAAPPVLDLKL